MKILTASLLVIIFFLLAVLHIYWGSGGKSGITASIPTKDYDKKIINPGPLACFAVATILFSFALFIFIKVHFLIFYIPSWLLNYGLWVIVALFLLRAIGEFKYVGFFKKVTTTKFGQMDTKYYSPLCLLISILAMILQSLD